MPEMLHYLIQSFQNAHEVAFNIWFYREEMKLRDIINILQSHVTSG